MVKQKNEYLADCKVFLVDCILKEWLMCTIIETLFLPQFKTNSVFRIEGGCSPEDGILRFKMDDHFGTGDGLVCPVGKNLAISLGDACFLREADIVWDEPEHFRIGFLSGKKPAILGYIGKNDTVHGHIPAGHTQHGIGISFLPEFLSGALAHDSRIAPEQFARALIALNNSPPSAEIVFTLRQIQTVLLSGRFSSLYCEAKTLEMIALILEWHTRTETIFPHGPTAQDRDGITEAIRYITAHYNEPIKLETLAKTAAMSVSKFTSVFKNLTGSTAANYIHRVRLERAKELLDQWQVPMESIAAAVGYKWHSNFSLVFKREFGVTPHEYRSGA
jgi:AraC-like DNA-binding protein